MAADLFCVHTADPIWKTKWPTASYSTVRWSLSIFKKKSDTTIRKTLWNLTLGSTLAINWLPVVESARSTIIARRPLEVHPYSKSPHSKWQSYTHPGGASRILFTNLSSASFPPSFNAFVTDLKPCSFVANSRRPVRRWERASSWCFEEPCSRTIYTIDQQSIEGTWRNLTVLNTIWPPLAFCYVSEDSRASVQ